MGGWLEALPTAVWWVLGLLAAGLGLLILGRPLRQLGRLAARRDLARAMKAEKSGAAAPSRAASTMA